MTDVVEIVVDVCHHQLLVVVHVGNGFAELFCTHTCLSTCPQVWSSLLEVRLGEGAHSAIHQSQHGCGIL